jgi:MFS family permease
MRVTLASLSLSVLLSSLGTSIANVALPTLAQTFGVSLYLVHVALSHTGAVDRRLPGRVRPAESEGRGARFS